LGASVPQRHSLIACALALCLAAPSVWGASIARIDRDLGWERCGPLRDPWTPAGTATDAIQLEADGAELYPDRREVRLYGNAVVFDQGHRLEADEIRYQEAGGRIEATGNLLLQQPGLLAAAASGVVERPSETGRFEGVEFRIPALRARGHAQVAEFQGADRSRYQGIGYSTCPPGEDHWLLEAGELEIDRADGSGTARDAKLSLFGVPLLYTPYLTFPLGDRRKSGLLPPAIGHSSETGLDISLPYYFNLAPNYDATLIPRVTSERGLLLGGELRYLTATQQGETDAELLPHDLAAEGDERTLRGAFAHRGGGRLGPGWRFDATYNWVSDNDYLEDLGGGEVVSRQRHLERRGDLIYAGRGWGFLGRVQGYQTIDDNIASGSEPYSRLPQLLLDLNRPGEAFGLTYHLRGEYVHFDRSSGVTGERLDLLPALSLPLRESWGFLTPKLGARYTGYRLQDQPAGWAVDPDRGLATFSLDGGLFLDRDTHWFGGTARQTLEPRLFYLYTPYERQDRLPLFDTAAFDFSFANLFRDNRFAGVDRVGDANQLTTALTSRTLAPDTGEELFRASLGQILYFRDLEVQLPGEPVVEAGSSALVAELAAGLGHGWNARGTLQWDPHADRDATENSALLLQYRDGGERLLNLGYRYQRDLLEQTDLSGRFHIGGRIHAVGRWNYSLLDDQTLDLFGGLEYGTCCWTTRVLARRYVNDVADDPQTTLMLQLELHGLASIGDRVDNFLHKGIRGYGPSDD
jgi:LPS-assembly protein